MSIVTVIGLDLGDKKHHFCALDAEGCVVQRGKMSCTKASLQRFLKTYEPCLVALEAGTHSPWVSRVAEQCGHRALVGNPRKLRMIFMHDYKNDQRDAEILARVARMDPLLLYPIHHRSEQAQGDLGVIRGRDALVRSRTLLINHARGVVKSFGSRLPACSADSFHRQVVGLVPSALKSALLPLLGTIGRLTGHIHDLDRLIEQLCTQRYPETQRLRGIKGVGPITSLTFVLTIEDPSRFGSGRALAAYLGLVPRRDQSGDIDKQLSITKAGNRYLRQLLVSCAHYVMGAFGEDSSLRSWGQHLAERGGKNARKRAVVAVARKLCVVLYALWTKGSEYQCFPQSQRAA